MAAPTTRICCRCRAMHSLSALKIPPSSSIVAVRFSSSKRLIPLANSQKSSDQAVTVTKDGQTIVCWHPEPQIPYEHTKPLPRRKYELENGDSPLKIQHIQASKKAKLKRPNGSTIKELCEMFHVTHHVFKQTPAKSRAKTDTPQDRKAL